MSPALPVAVHRRCPVDALHDRVLRLGGVTQVAGAKGGVERAVAARPHAEATAAGGHVVDVAHHAEVKGMAVAVATDRRARTVAERQNAVDAANPLRRRQLAGAEHLLRHGEDARIGGQHAHDPRLGADAAVLPVEMPADAVGVVGQVARRQRPDPGTRVIPLQGRRRVIPQALPRPSHQPRVHHAPLDEIPVALEQAQLIRCQQHCVPTVVCLPCRRNVFPSS